VSQLFEEPDEEEEEAEETEADLSQSAPAEASLEELLAKRTDVVAGDEDEDTLLDLSREERMESLTFRAVPKQANEFVCASCFLVKNLSQLADPVKNLCRDCV
jgi:hypothetical protein